MQCCLVKFTFVIDAFECDVTQISRFTSFFSMKFDCGYNFVLLALTTLTVHARIITEDQLSQIFTGANSKLIKEYTPLLDEAMIWGQIDACERVVSFIAQVAVESDQLQRLQELGTGSHHENKCPTLGNCQPGDGKKFKGRGALRVIGRKNYASIGKELKVDFEHDPKSLALPKYAFKAAAWIWKVNGLNSFADVNDQKSFEQIIKKLNGCLDCAAAQSARKLQFWKKAKTVLKC